MSRRRCLIECTREVLTLLQAGKALGFTVAAQREVFGCDAWEAILESEFLPPVQEGAVYPRATLRENPDKTLSVVFDQ